MIRLIGSVFLLGMLISGLAGCSSGATPSPTPSAVALGEKFELAPGQSQSVAGEDLSLKMVGVTADSRCPLGVECIQAGQAVCQVEITSHGQVSTRDLVEMGLVSGTASAEMGVYHLVFQILPYPEAGKQIKGSDYRLILTVTR
jgi:hypothetical protein